MHYRGGFWGYIPLDRRSFVKYDIIYRKELALPTILREYGYRFHFYSNEGKEPPHVHVTGKGGEMKVWIPDMVVEFS